MTTLEQHWEQEVRASRLVILPGERSYVKVVGIPVWSVLQQLAGGLSEQQLRQRYPALTRADIRACQLFGYLRAIRVV